MEMYLRCFAEVASIAGAKKVSHELNEQLSFLGPAKREEAQRYWKIPEYHEIFLCYEISDLRVFKRVLMALGTGWQVTDGTEAVWNHSESSTFISNKVRWAQLEALA